MQVREYRTGTHVMRVEGDVLFLKWVGDFQLADMIELHIVAEQMFAEHAIGYLLAGD
jgi:hypothetical protein